MRKQAMKLNSCIIRLQFSALILLSACSKVIDEQPRPISQIPDAVANVLIAAHPNAKNITVKTVAKDKEWEARFSEGLIEYYVALNPSEILATHKLISPTVPDSIKENFEVIPVLSPNKGILSDYREIIDPHLGNRYYTAKFTVDQKDYLLKFKTWLGQPSGDYSVTVTDYYKFNYFAQNDRISAYLRQHAYSDVLINTTVRDDNKKNRYAWTNHTNGESGMMVFDDETQLIVSFRKEAPVTSLSDFPKKIQNFIANTGLPLTDQNYKFAELNASGYHLLLVGIFGHNGYRYTVDFDQDGNIIGFELSIAIVHNRK